MLLLPGVGSSTLVQSKRSILYSAAFYFISFFEDFVETQSESVGTVGGARQQNDKMARVSTTTPVEGRPGREY